MFNESFWQDIEHENPEAVRPFIERRKKKNPMRAGHAEAEASADDSASSQSNQAPAVPIRERIFDSEFEKAAADVIAHNGTQENTGFISSPLQGSSADAPGMSYRFSDFRLPGPENTMDQYLLELYNNPGTVQSFLGLWIRQFRADACCFLVLADDQLEYRPAMSLDVDDETLSRLRFSINDHYFEPDGMVEFRFDEGPGLERYFRKRFSGRMLSEHGKCIIHHRTDPVTPVILVLFYRSVSADFRALYPDETVQQTIHALTSFLSAEVTRNSTGSLVSDICEQGFLRLNRFFRRNSRTHRLIFRFEGLDAHPRREAFLNEFEVLLRGRTNMLGMRLHSDKMLIFVTEDGLSSIRQSVYGVAETYGISLQETQESLDHKYNNPYASLL